MKIIKDPVHGYIEVGEFLLPVLDSPLLQRLRHIKQLGFSYLVYPGANHTRFEHSLGTMHLAEIMCRQLNLDEDDRALIIAAALIHDIGHGPFSHSIEPVMREFTGREHHDIAWMLKDEPVMGQLADRGVDPGELAGVVSGRHRLSGIIRGDLDVDRMDYLLRDAHYTGAPYGTVDAHRLIRSTMLSEDGIVLGESGINAAESLLIARTLMRPAVYFHHVSRIAEAMFTRAVSEHLARSPRAEAELMMRLNDFECMHTLLHSHSREARSFIERIHLRQLYKRAITAGATVIHPSSLQAYRTHESREKLAREIAELAGIVPSGVLVDIPPLPVPMSMEVQVLDQHTTIRLEEKSPLVNTLNATRLSQWYLGIYAQPGDTQAVSEAATEMLRIRPATKQGRLPF